MVSIVLPRGQRARSDRIFEKASSHPSPTLTHPPTHTVLLLQWYDQPSHVSHVFSPIAL